jgi:UDP-galactopyranose mutase
MRVVSSQLKSRLYDLQLNKRLEERAKMIAEQREAQRKKLYAAQAEKEKQAVFQQLLTTIFKKWTAKLWRYSQAYILKKEMVGISFAALAIISKSKSAWLTSVSLN